MALSTLAVGLIPTNPALAAAKRVASPLLGEGVLSARGTRLMRFARLAQVSSK
jgi:hypothetical protein